MYDKEDELEQLLSLPKTSLNYQYTLRIQIKNSEKTDIDSCLSEEESTTCFIFLFFDGEAAMKDFYSSLVEEVYFSKEALSNYISSCIYDVLINFSHMSDNLIKVIKTIKLISQNSDSPGEIQISTLMDKEIKQVHKVLMNSKISLYDKKA